MLTVHAGRRRSAAMTVAVCLRSATKSQWQDLSELILAPFKHLQTPAWIVNRKPRSWSMQVPNEDIQARSFFVFILWLKKRSFLGLERSIFGANAHFAECVPVQSSGRSFFLTPHIVEVCQGLYAKETNHPIDEQPNRFTVDSTADSAVQNAG